MVGKAAAPVNPEVRTYCRSAGEALYSAPMSHSFAILSRRVVIDGEIRPAAILIDGERIADIVEIDQVPPGHAIDDRGDQVVMAGVVDVHVHVNEPGRTDWEGFETATRAACAGGITTLVDMPLNSSPVTTNAAAFREKLAAAEGQLFVDCGFYAGLVPGNADRLEELIDAGVLGVKAFLCHSGIDEFPNATEDDLRAAMPILARRGVPLLVHAELVDDHNSSALAEDPRNYAAYAASRPQRWEVRAIQLLIELCRETGCHVHIVHLAASKALPILRDARKEGLPITVETGPHYLYFSASEIADGDTLAKCAPPIRDDDNRRRLIDALIDGEIDFVATDHSPSPPSMKALESGDFQKAWGGISSLQILLPALWTALAARDVEIPDIARWLAEAPAKLVGLSDEVGTIAPGKLANLVIWDPQASFEVAPKKLHHRHPITPYKGHKLRGLVHATYLRGQAIFDQQTVHPEPTGRALFTTKE